jgi:myo-inositol 2-dehydrogenase/D-chiro-inositol 1-dehydrogenase
MQKLEVAIIGCGGMGTRHTQNLAKLAGVHISAFVDRDLERAQRLQALVGTGHATTDPTEVFDDPRIQAVVIATHHDSHPALAIAAAQAGKHILIEKPLALTNEACRAIEAAVQAAGVQLLVGFQARHAPLVRRAREWLPDSRVLFGQFVCSRWGDHIWAQQPDIGGGNVLSQGVHCFDLLAYFAGAAPTVVYAQGGTLTHDPATTSVIDSVCATIRFANGAVAGAVVGDFGPSPWTLLAYYELFDARGKSATLYHYYEGLCLGTAGARDRPGGPEREAPQQITVQDLSPAEQEDRYGYAALVSEFVACARENRPPAIAAGVRDGRRATAVALACFESIRTGRPVTLDEA